MFYGSFAVIQGTIRYDVDTQSDVRFCDIYLAILNDIITSKWSHKMLTVRGFFIEMYLTF